MDRSLDSLSSECYPKACEVIARCAARGVAVMVVQTSRTQAENQANLLAGTSGTSMSSHLPRKMRWRPEILPLTDPEKSDAIDLAPYAQYQLHGPDKLRWTTSDPVWGIIGEEIERVGLRWGGRWRTPFDPGHGELVLPWKAALRAEEIARPWPYPMRTDVRGVEMTDP